MCRLGHQIEDAIRRTMSKHVAEDWKNVEGGERDPTSDYNSTNKKRKIYITCGGFISSALTTKVCLV